MIQVQIYDHRGGHDGIANGGHYGGFSELLVKPRPGYRIEESVFIVTDEDKGSYGDHQHLTDRSMIFDIDQAKVDWACIHKGHTSQAMLAGRSDRHSWEEIPGIPGGPKVQLQAFLEAYPNWVDQNAALATDWLKATAIRLGKADISEAVSFAQRKSSKGTISSAWEAVASLSDVELKWGSMSWTAVKSAPLKIALAVQKKHKESWGLKGLNAFRYEGDRPMHPGEAAGYTVLPSSY